MRGVRVPRPSPTTSRWEIYVGSALLGAGIGLAFASLANLIVEAVPPEQTGVATGMNTVMRSLGGSVGGQIGASVLAGTVAADGLPTEQGFTIAFVLAAGACGLATLASFAVPRPARSGLHRPGSWRASTPEIDDGLLFDDPRRARRLARCVGRARSTPRDWRGTSTLASS